MLSIEKAMFLEVCSGFSSGLKYRYPDIDVEGIFRPETVVLDGDHLVELAALCRSGYPEGVALIEALRDHAEPLLTEPDNSVVQKTHVEAGLSSNDYCSLAKYWWPDKQSDNGLPYVRHDGEVNPDCYSDRYDAARLVNMVEGLQVLSLAAWLTGDQRYAECAVRRIEVWFLNDATRQTPHFEYAQQVPGRPQTRGAAIIEARHLIYVTEAALLLEAMNALTGEQSAALRQWFGSLLNWLQNSETGQEAAQAGNNIGFWYDLQRIAYAWFTGDSALVESLALNDVRVRALNQIELDGTLDMEMQRARPQDYVSFTLVAMAQLSRYAERVDVPLWDQQDADGRGFQVAHEWLSHQVESRQARQRASTLQALTLSTKDGIDKSRWQAKTAASNISDLTMRLGLVNRLAERRQQMLTQKAQHNRVHLEHIQTLKDKLKAAEKTIKSLRKHSEARESEQTQSLEQSHQRESELFDMIAPMQEQIKAQQQENARLADQMATFEQQHQEQWTLFSDSIEALKKQLYTPPAIKPSQDGASEVSRKQKFARQADIVHRDQKIDTLNSQLVELNRRLVREQQKNSALLSSHSWRLMTPFRRLRHMMGHTAGSKPSATAPKRLDTSTTLKSSDTSTTSKRVSAQTEVEKTFDPLAVLHDVKPCNSDALQRAYREKKLDQVPDTFLLYRIIGNDLYPRHRKGQTRDNLRFILENEQAFEHCEKRWIVNRIVDSSEERAVIRLLEAHDQTWMHIPFDAQEYREIEQDYQGLPDPDFLRSDDFESLPPHQKKRIQTATYRLKNNYVMNNNGARNTALRQGRQEGKWVLPWDGNCFVTPEAWQAITAAVTQRPWLTHFVVPMARIMDNAHLLVQGFQPHPVEEPQLIFRRDTTSDFNEAFCYGRRPKIEMLWHLGVPGKWDDWSDELGDQPRRALSAEAFQWGVAGWVARLFSGMGHMETPDAAGAVSRNQHRQDAIMDFLDRVDDLAALHANDQRDMLLEETDSRSTRTEMKSDIPSEESIPFIFGISLRARSTTNNWSLVCQNLERTLRNLARQSDTDFQVYIVVHDIPEIDTQGLDVNFITVDFPVSLNEEGRPFNDKNRKKRILGAHLRAQHLPAFYFMGLDADDLLHPDLVKTVRNGNSKAGYLIERGYIYDCVSQGVGRCNEHTKRFWEQCGSCAIFYIEREDLPVNNGDKQAYFSRLAEHSKYHIVAREHGRELISLEQYMGVYLVNHGENDWSIYRGREGSKERYVRRNGISNAEVVAFHETWPELGSSM